MSPNIIIIVIIAQI